MEADASHNQMTVHEAVEQIYETERESIYSYLLYFGVPPQRAQELVQDSFLRLYRNMQKGAAIENPRAWLHTVARNLAVRSFKEELAFDELDPNLHALEPSTGPEQTLIDQERRRALIRAVGSLSSQQKHCFHLRSQGFKLREIAEVMGISTSAVAEFLRRAAVRLKETLNG
jgi:RNA polymerase sigma-70 factor (ECF subfamily)